MEASFPPMRRRGTGRLVAAGALAIAISASAPGTQAAKGTSVKQIAPGASDTVAAWKDFGFPDPVARELERVARERVSIEGRGLDAGSVYRILMGLPDERKEDVRTMVGNARLAEIASTSVDGAEELADMLIAVARDRRADWHLRRPLAERCRARSREANEEVDAGPVLLRFSVGADGSVVAAEVSRAAARRPAFEGCLVEVLRTLRFPRPADGRPVSIAYRLLTKAQSGYVEKGFGLSMKEILAAAEPRLSQGALCRSPAPGRPPGAIVRFEIGPDGRARELDFRGRGSRMWTPPEKECLLDLLRGTAFPPPKDGEPITVIYVFAPRGRG